jgi:hypothetical protein
VVGALASGIRVPEDLLIVAHANFPDPAPCALPAVRIGYDADAVLDAGIALLRRIAAGAGRDARVVVPPRVDG